MINYNRKNLVYLLNRFSPDALLPTSTIFDPLNALVFLAALSHPAAVNVFELSGTICLALPKCHSPYLYS